MSFKGDLSTIGLAEVFQMISMSQKEGTLVVQDAESRKAIYFGADGVQLHSAGKRKGFRIGDILVRAGKISVGQLREVLEQQQGTKRKLGEELIGRGLITEQEIQDVVKSQIEEEIYDLFLWRKATFEFIEGPPIEELQDPETRAIRLAFDVNSLLLEAVRRTDEWTLINQKIPSMDGIYTWVSAAAREEEDASATEANRAVYQYVDGQAMVTDIIEQSFVPRFEVCKLLIDLLDRGRVRLLTPTELVTVARQRLEEGRRDKGLKLFQVAAQLAPEDPDLIGKYAHALETEGMIQEAARMYVRVGALLKQQGQGKDALAYFQRAVSLNPDDVQSKIALFEINLATASVEEAMATASELVANCLRERDFDTAREIAEQAVAAAPQSLEMRLALAKVYHQLGMKKERDEVVLFLRKNLPIDQGAADKIIAELRELSEKAEEAAPRVVTAGPRRRRRGGGVSLKRIAAVLLFLGLGVGAAFAVSYEMSARRDLEARLRDSADLERDKKWDEARQKISAFHSGPYRHSFLTAAKADEALRQLNERIAEATRPPKTGPGPTVDDVERQRKEREAAIARVQTLHAEMRRQHANAEYDNALATSDRLRAEAAQCGQTEIAKDAARVYEQLSKEYLKVLQLKAAADALERDGQFREACKAIQDLRQVYALGWKVAREARFPFAVIARPVGAKIYRNAEKDPLAVSTGEAVVLHLDPFTPAFVLRFEKAGYRSKTSEKLDERTGLVEVTLDERLAVESGPLGIKLLANPEMANGLIYAFAEVNSEGRVYAFDLNRVPQWHEKGDTPPRAGPDGLVFFGRGRKVVGRGSDRIDWEFQAESDVTSPVCFSEDGATVYFAAGRKLYAVDRAGTKEAWTRDLPASARVAPVAFGDGVCIACEDNALYGVRREGEPWKIQTGGRLRAPPALVAPHGNGVPRSGTLYFGSEDGRLYAVDARTGKEKWNEAVGEVHTTPVVVEDRIYVGSAEGTVVCLDEQGQDAWRRTPGGRIQGGVVVTGGRVLVGDLKGGFHFLDAATGGPLGSFTTRDGHPIRTVPVVVDGRVYVAADDRTLYVLRLD